MKQLVLFFATMFAVALIMAVALIAFDWAMSPAPRVCDTMVSTTTCEASP